MQKGIILLALTAGLLGGCSEKQQFIIPESVGDHWYKGNTHTHTTESDGNATPEEAASWYKNHGYDFLYITDHNKLTPIEPLAHLVDENFILIPGDEVSASNKAVVNDTQKRAIHVNSLNVNVSLGPIYDSTVVGTLQKNVDAIIAAGGIPVIAHPNFRWSFGAKEMLQVENVQHFEVYNMHPEINNLGDDTHASTEEMWDEMLTAGKKIYGVASDDAHHIVGDYVPTRANPGRGWVVVRAKALDGDAISKNLKNGHFYSSSGVTLDDIIVTANTLEIKIQQWEDERYRTDFIGSNGKILQTGYDNPARFTLDQKTTYVRALVTSSNGSRAWVQPVFVE